MRCITILTTSQMVCSLGDAFSVHNGSRFQTSDSYQSNCTVSLGGGGWWFPQTAGCGEAYITGAGNIEGNTNHSTQMYWTGKRGRIYLQEVTMKFRDKDFNTGSDNCVFHFIYNVCRAHCSRYESCGSF